MDDRRIYRIKEPQFAYDSGSGEWHFPFVLGVFTAWKEESGRFQIHYRVEGRHIWSTSALSLGDVIGAIRKRQREMLGRFLEDVTAFEITYNPPPMEEDIAEAVKQFRERYGASQPLTVLPRGMHYTTYSGPSEVTAAFMEAAEIEASTPISAGGLQIDPNWLLHMAEQEPDCISAGGMYHRLGMLCSACGATGAACTKDGEWENCLMCYGTGVRRE